MDKQQMVEKVTEVLRPFESANLIDTMKHLTVKQLFSHPIILILIIALLFFGIIKKSKTVLLSLFSLFCVALLVQFAMPPPGSDFTMSTLLPFIGGGLVIGCVVIYFTFIKSD